MLVLGADAPRELVCGGGMFRLGSPKGFSSRPEPDMGILLWVRLFDDQENALIHTLLFAV